jgi:hypothetical protein
MSRVGSCGLVSDLRSEISDIRVIRHGVCARVRPLFFLMGPYFPVQLPGEFIFSSVELVVHLQSHPELWRYTEVPCQPQCGIGCHATLTEDNLVDASCGDAHRECKPILAQFHRSQKLLKQDLSRMKRFKFCHRIIPCGSQRSRHRGHPSRPIEKLRTGGLRHRDDWIFVILVQSTVNVFAWDSMAARTLSTDKGSMGALRSRGGSSRTHVLPAAT